MSIPLIDVRAHRERIGAQIDAGIQRVVERGDWIMGTEVAQLETALADWTGVPTTEVVACANGTDALVLAIQSLGLRPGQAVVCPAFTFVATAEAVATCGGIPLFADVDLHDFNIDPDSARAVMTRAEADGLDVAGIIAVDLFGTPARYEDLAGPANDFGCWIIADAAQSFGASRRGAAVGTLADVTTTSFFPAKPLGCYGDGGALFTDNPEVAATARSLRVHGKGTSKYDNVRIGHNSRLDTIQAAILLSKLEIFAEELAARDKLAEAYDAALAPYVETPDPGFDVTSAWAQYTIKAPDRDGLKRALADAEIGSAVYYERPLTRQPAFDPYRAHMAEVPTSDRLSSTVLSLPMHPYLPETHMDRIIETVQTFQRRSA